MICVNPLVEGKTLKLELDAGSALSVILWEQYKKFRTIETGGEPSGLENLHGGKITPKEMIKCNVKFKG